MSKRPNPIQWIGYVYGAKLPESQTDWVANDLMGPHAFLRHMIRSQVSFVPVYLVLFFAFPSGPVWVRLLMVLLGACLALIFSVSYMDQNRVRRLQKHGLGNTPETYRQRAEAEHLKTQYEKIYGARNG
ncbi:DUF5313 domain-containing protein [Gordonia alkaliphila]|uniref:DUF5313 domain-containing protein n=2 Tax=Gordonia TaxID=2053 RepID=A0ABP8ZIN9_9ACTN|nr:DUF5313 family protein [Gordonia alkaliphila]MCK0438938.1 DUF5313 domain-containing protein [Gordonia alkaliphila]